MRKIYIAGCLEILGGAATNNEYEDLMNYVRIYMGEEAEQMIREYTCPKRQECLEEELS